MFSMNEEIKSFYNNRTWKLVKPPQAQKFVGCKWIYKRKDGILKVDDAWFKACLVAKIFTQKESVDFNEVSSLVVKYSSIRVLFVMVALFYLELEQLDVKITFLHNELEKRIYIPHLEGFIT